MEQKHQHRVMTILNGVKTMKYFLVDRYDNIVDTKDLSSDVGVKGATTYFVKRKQISYENFIQLWKVMTEKEYNTQRELATRRNKQYEWWKDDDSYLDIDK